MRQGEILIYWTFFFNFTLMETIFDFNPTKQELFKILSLETATKEWYLDMYDPNLFSLHLCSLFYIRKDEKNLNFWLDKLDNLSKIDFFRTVNHP